MHKSVFKPILRDLGPILLRNIFSLVVIIIGGLSIALIALGDARDGIFLGLVITINIVVGIVQELRARVALEKLQATVASHYTVDREGHRIEVFAEDILRGDIVSLQLGDQVPVDGVVETSNSLECNEALLTGESNNITKATSERLLAGSIIVAGSATLRATKSAGESYLASMTNSLKRYSRNLSPIQRSMLGFIQLMAGVLLVIAIIIVSRSLLSGDSLVSAISQVAAIASTIIAEGLILTSTLFFTYGAVRMSQQKVLLQQINAIEMLGRVATVCVDKTGTLTANTPVFESFISYSKGEGDKSEMKKLLATYAKAESAHTTTLDVIVEATKGSAAYPYTDLLPFSSSRKYAAVTLKDMQKIILIGAPDYFVSYLSSAQQVWLKSQLKDLGVQAKRVVLVATAVGGDPTKLNSLKQLNVQGLVVMANPLKVGTRDTIAFLQQRGVSVLVISGDNAQTVAAIADSAGIAHGSKTITGDELEEYTDANLRTAIIDHPLFARILPSQKERIVIAAQHSGQVAMIGDGANDALAIKQADVGIAMFAGASATRQIADAVLLNNSFAALPRGIELSDSIITTLEMIACLFFSRVWSGVLLLFATLLINISYPFAPRNLTLLNICIIAFPIALWGLWPRSRQRSIHEPSFLHRTLPFSILNGALIAFASICTYYLSSMLLHVSIDQAQLSAYLCFAIMSIFTISIVPRAMQTIDDRHGQLAIYCAFGPMALLIFIALTNPTVSKFFGLHTPDSIAIIGLGIVVALVGTLAQKGFANLRIGDRLSARVMVLRKSKKAHTI